MKVRRVELGKIEKSKEKLSACIGYFDGMVGIFRAGFFRIGKTDEEKNHI